MLRFLVHHFHMVVMVNLGPPCNNSYVKNIDSPFYYSIWLCLNHSTMIMVIASYSSSLEDFKNKNDALKKQVEDLTSTLAKFTQGIDNLDVLLGGQNKSLNKKWFRF